MVNRLLKKRKKKILNFDVNTCVDFRCLKTIFFILIKLHAVCLSSFYSSSSVNAKYRNSLSPNLDSRFFVLEMCAKDASLDLLVFLSISNSKTFLAKKTELCPISCLMAVWRQYSLTEQDCLKIILMPLLSTFLHATLTKC